MTFDELKQALYGDSIEISGDDLDSFSRAADRIRFRPRCAEAA